MIDLKRCQFCGGSAELEYAPLDDDSFAEEDGYVCCACCSLTMFGHDREHTEMRWNARVEVDEEAKA